MTGRGGSRRSDPRAWARSLIACSEAELRRRLEAASVAEPERLLVHLREEAGRYYHADAARARRIALRARAIAELLEDGRALGWAHRIMAEALLFSGRIREADVSYAAADRIWQRAGADAPRGQLLVARTHVLALLGRMSEVEPTARTAARLLEAAGDREYLAKLAMNVGSIHFQRDQYEQALEAYERARELFGALGVRDQTVVGLDVNRAVALTQLDRDAEALALFGRLERDCGRRGFELLQAQVRMNQGYVLYLRGEVDLALQQIARAADYFRRTDHPAFLGNCLINRAEIYQQLNLHDEGLEMCREAEAQFECAGLPYDRALALSHAGMLHLARGEPGPALVAIRRAARLFRKERNEIRVTLMTYFEAAALARSGRPAKARELSRRAQVAFRRRKLVRWEAAAGALWLQLRTDLTLAQRARLIRQLLRKVPERIYPQQALSLLTLLAKVQEEAGSKRAARRSYGRAVEHLEFLRRRVPTEDSKIAFLGDKAHLYDRLLSMELDRARPNLDRLFDWMERARAQSLWDRVRLPSGAGAAVAGPDTVALRRRLSWLHARISRLELGTAEERSRAAKLHEDLGRLERDYERARRSEEESRPHRGPDQAAARGPEPGPASPAVGASSGPAAVAAALPRDSGFLSYHVGPDFALAIGMTREGARCYRLPSDLSSRLAALCDQLDFHWSAAALTSARQQATRTEGEAPAAPDAPTAAGTTSGALLETAARQTLERLYGLLWQPLEDQGLPVRGRWLISPHGPLHRIPLHALAAPDGYLIEKATIHIIPSARIWLRTPRRYRRRPRRIYLSALPSRSLPAVAGEVKRARRLLAGWNRTVDLAPTRASLEREAARAAIVHIAAHGELRADNPAFSSIELADGPLFVHDLTGLRMKGTVVVLTACHSGSAVAPAGDEWIGLARGFLQAGAAQVVASLWPIGDQATSDLMEGFYGHLAACGCAEQSLRRAMLDLQPRYPHPWFWASFAVFGGRAPSWKAPARA